MADKASDDERLSQAAKRLRQAMDMHETGMQMWRQRLRRENPDATDEEISATIKESLRTRPLDADGRPSHRFD